MRSTESSHVAAADVVNAVVPEHKWQSVQLSEMLLTIVDIVDC